MVTVSVREGKQARMAQQLYNQLNAALEQDQTQHAEEMEKARVQHLDELERACNQHADKIAGYGPWPKPDMDSSRRQR